MRRLDHADIQRNIEIQLRTLRGPTKTALQHVRGDAAAEAAARLIVERCLSGCVVFAPDRFRAPKPANQPGDWGDSHGEFGKTEPFPSAPAERAPGRCLLCTANDVDSLAHDLAGLMWSVLQREPPFDQAGRWRAHFLLMAHRVINRLGG